MRLSVIMPTYNRIDALQDALKGLFAQEGAEFEILIVDDGSTDETPERVKDWSEKAPVPVRYFRQENKGPAAARNLGIREAKGEILLFVGDDILFGKEALARHLEDHALHPDHSVAVLGKVEWKPPVTPFMQWLDEEGIQFAYHLIEGEWADYRFCYTCNVSFKAEFLRAHGGFDERFPFAAYEDNELAYRLSKTGLRIFYDPRIHALHDHAIDFAGSLRRYAKVARSAWIFASIHPEKSRELQAFGLKPTPWILMKLWGAKLVAPFSPAVRKRYWRGATRIAFYRGFGGAE